MTLGGLRSAEPDAHREREILWFTRAAHGRISPTARFPYSPLAVLRNVIIIRGLRASSTHGYGSVRVRTQAAAAAAATAEAHHNAGCIQMMFWPAARLHIERNSSPPSPRLVGSPVIYLRRFSVPPPQRAARYRRCRNFSPFFGRYEEESVVKLLRHVSRSNGRQMPSRSVQWMLLLHDTRVIKLN